MPKPGHFIFPEQWLPRPLPSLIVNSHLIRVLTGQAAGCVCVISVCLPLVSRGLQPFHVFTGKLCIFLEKCLFISFVHFTISLFYLNWLTSFLYISIHGLSDMCLSLVPTHSVGGFSLPWRMFIMIFIYVYVFVPSWIYAHSMSADLRISEDIRYHGAGVTGHCEPLDIVSHLTGILRVKLRSSEKATAVLNCWAISPAQLFTSSLLYTFMGCNLMFYIGKHYGTIKSR